MMFLLVETQRTWVQALMMLLHCTNCILFCFVFLSTRDQTRLWTYEVSATPPRASSSEFKNNGEKINQISLALF